ncbi:alpha/beta hydrolase [Microbacterium sp. NPDC087665]|uniref:alpha/beta hydrolase n=1 Tax=Microbacterium sp. NPDC087665 TaxID=3364194 RepID=UPI00382DA9FE
MSAFVAHTLRDVPSSAAMSALGVDAEKLGVTVSEAMDAVNSQWWALDGAFEIIPNGNPVAVMERPLRSAEDFADVMAQVKKVLVVSAEDVFAKFERTRADLQGTIENLNGRHRAHSLILEGEVATFQADPENDPTITGRNHPETDAYTTAHVNLGLLDQEAERLALEVEMFHRQLAQAEQDLADQIRALSGGDEVMRYDGTRVKTAQTVWGLFPPGAPSGPGTAPTVVSFTDYFDLSVARATTDRIHWMTTANEQDVADWLAAHPEFFAAIGFIPPPQSAALYEQLASKSTADASGAWTAGPLATLWSRAPGAIGNLNGLKTSVRAPFAAHEVERLLADPTVSDEAKDKLRLLQAAASDAMRILSTFIDDTGNPRASLMIGDPDTVDQVITITHGISTDLGSIDEWATITRDIYDFANSQIIDARHINSTTAVILQAEWDSGGAATVQRDDIPSTGASREVALVEGLRYVNPGASQEGWAHSLGTTATTIAQMQSPGLFDHMTLFGSAGITDEAAAEMGEALVNDDVTVSATSAEDDWIAMWGRLENVSTHDIDPRGEARVEMFGSDGGVVTDYITPDDEPVIGLPTGGHNAGASEEFIYRIHRAPGWNLTLQGGVGMGLIGAVGTMPADSVGYLDPRGQSFLQAIADFAERVEARQ